MYYAPVSINGSTAATTSALWAFRVPHAAAKNLHFRYIDLTLGGLGASTGTTYGVELIRLTATGAPSAGTGLVPVKGWESHPASILTTSDLMMSATALTGLGGGGFNSNSFANLLFNASSTTTLSTRLQLEFDKTGDGSMVFRPSGAANVASESFAIRVIANAMTATLTLSGTIFWDEDSI